MNRLRSYFLPAVLLLAATGLPAAVPYIFCTDLESGPATGGEAGGGAFVTLYGRGFGAQKGGSTVLLAGKEINRYKVWTDTKVSVQLAPGAASGDFTLKTGEGESNGVPFRVRPGKIHTAGKGGNFKTIQDAIDKIGPGDIIYVLDGTVETRPGTSDGSVTIRGSGQPGLPKALVGYPGAKATIGAPTAKPCYETNCVEGAFSSKVQEPANHWVVAGMYFRGATVALGLGYPPGKPARDWRVVGNDISCPGGDGQAACFDTSGKQLREVLRQLRPPRRRGRRPRAELLPGRLFLYRLEFH